MAQLNFFRLVIKTLFEIQVYGCEAQVEQICCVTMSNFQPKPKISSSFSYVVYHMQGKITEC